MIHYSLPTNWLRYDATRLVGPLTKAKAAVLSLGTVPYQRRWVEALQKIELKREVAGTSRIEGAEFTDRELDEALRPQDGESLEELKTRSQRQARAALNAYDWIRRVPAAAPVTRETILQIHRLMVVDADDDHCPPGKLRESGQNVTFGRPAHRGCEGGNLCEDAFNAFASALQNEFQAHDPLIQAIAAHYHIAAMHPFLDGNGRTARALEALLLGRAGLRNTTFIAMSNYYYDEKIEYLTTLATVRQRDFDLTDFLAFALKGVELQAVRLLKEIQREIKLELFRNLAHELFGRLRSPRKRVLAKRQVVILETLLGANGILTFRELVEKLLGSYSGLKNESKALVRDIAGLEGLGTVTIEKTRLERDSELAPGDRFQVRVNFDWPQEITETEFFQRVRSMPKARTQLSVE